VPEALACIPIIRKNNPGFNHSNSAFDKTRAIPLLKEGQPDEARPYIPVEEGEKDPWNG
jgi:hypothetical protein